MKSVKDIILLFIYLVVATLLTYYIPAQFNRLIFLFFLILFYRSKQDYLWIAFLFILIMEPGGLFSGEERVDQMRLPLYSINPGASLSFTQLFIITALAKALKSKRRFWPMPFLKQNLYRLGFYFIFLYILTIAMDVSFHCLISMLILVVELSMFYSMFILFRDESDFINFFRLIFPFAFIAFGLQLYDITFGHQLISIFKASVISVQGALGDKGGQRPIEMMELLLIVFFGSIYFMAGRTKHFQNTYLISVNIISYFAIIISATRTWVAAFTCGYLLYFLLSPNKSLKVIYKYSLIIILILLLLFSSNLFKNQYNDSMKRILTIELLLQGDITAGGTSIRYDKRAPAVMDAFNESTIFFGAAFSKLYSRHDDHHVGFHNLLFNTGITGIVLFTLFIFKLIQYPILISRQLSLDNPYKNRLKISPIFIFMVLILNGGTQIIGYDVGSARIFIFAFILFFTENQITKALLFQKNLNTSQMA